MRMDNLCNEGPHGLLHQLGVRLRKSLRVVGAKSGDNRVDYTDIGGDITVRNLITKTLYKSMCKNATQNSLQAIIISY